MTGFFKTAKGRVAVIGAAAAVAAAAVLTVVLLNGETAYRSICLSEVSGKVITENNGKSYDAYKNMVLVGGYSLTTEGESYTRMQLDGDKYMKLEEESRAIFENLGDPQNHRTAIRLDYGALSAEITQPLSQDESFIVNTPNAVLAVRGTFFRAAVSFDANGDVYTDVSAYGGTVVCHRIMPDGTEVDEEVEIGKGYKALIKMDEIITVYVEELAEIEEDNVDPLEIEDVHDGQLVDVYNASVNGHEMFRSSKELWREIEVRDIDLSIYTSAYDGGEIPSFDQISAETEAFVSMPSETEADVTTSSETEADISTSSETEATAPELSETQAVTEALTEIKPSQSRPKETEASAAVSNGTQGTAQLPALSSTADNKTEYLPSGTAPTEGPPSSGGEPLPHTHSEATEKVDASCTESGYIRVYCSECGEILSKSEIPPLGHSETAYRVNSTCTENGSSTVVCGICGTVISSETIPASGHNTRLIITEEPGCETAGLGEEICESCGETIAYKEIPAVGHDTKVTVTEKPSCLTEGLEQESCTRCGLLISVRTVPALGHSEVSDRAEPTCTENGSVTVHCGICGIVLSREEIPASGHDTEIRTTEPRCEAEGFREEVCRLCGKIFSSDTIPALGHSAGAPETVEPTCTEDGSITVRCVRCGKIISQEAIPALGHSETEETASPTCTENGRNTVKCSVCGRIISEETIPALGHDTEVRVTALPTCVTEGEETEACTICGEVVAVRKTAATGHTEVTEIEGNFRIIKCSVCGEIISSTSIEGGFSYPVAIDERNFPDEGFRRYVASYFDVNRDERLSYEECEAVTEIYIAGEPDVSSLKGIEYFRNLQALDCTDCGLTALDISGNPELERLHCSGTSIGELDLSGNKKLGSLYCSDTPIRRLDVSKNTELCNLDCSQTPISELDLSKNTNLEWLRCSDTNIAYLDTSNCTYLYHLSVENNKHRITVIDGVFDTKTIKGFDPVRAFDFREINNYVNWDAETGILSEIIDGTAEIIYQYDCNGDGSYDTEFTFVIDENSTFMPGSGMIEINEDNFPDEIFREYVGLHFDMDGDGWLSKKERDDVSIIGITGFEGIVSLKGIESFVHLRDLDCTNISTLTNLDVSGNSELLRLTCCDTSIEKLDVSKNIKLEYLDCSRTNISELNLSSNIQLNWLECSETNIACLDTSNCPYLPYINAGNVRHRITVTDGVFDTKTIKGFDPVRAYDFREGNGYVRWDAETGILSEIIDGTAEIFYQYDCNGDGWYDTEFIFVIDENSTFMPGSGMIEMNEENFPDEIFRDYVVMHFDTDGDGRLSKKERDDVLNIGIAGYEGIVSLKGIENFVHLRDLDCPDISTLTSLDVSGNPELDRLNCSDTSIGELDLSKNKKLENLHCRNTLLSVLDVSRNTELLNLECSSTQISELDLRNNINLNWLNCSDTNIAYLDTSNCPNLTYPYYGNFNNLRHYITVTDGVFNTKSIKGFDPTRAYDFWAENYDVGWDADTGILSKIVDGTAEITYHYDCNGDGSYDVMFTFIPDENSTFMPGSKKIPIDETTFPDELFREYVIGHFDSDRDDMLSKREREFAQRIEFHLEYAESGASMSLKGIECLDDLKELEIRATGVSSLDFGNSSSLTLLRCEIWDSPVDVDLSCYPSLAELHITGQQITSVNLTGNDMLTALDIYGLHSVTELDLSANRELTYLDCFDNNILYLDLRNCVKLKEGNYHISNNYGDFENLIPSNIKYIYLSERTEWRKIDVSKIIELRDAVYDSKLNAFVVENNYRHIGYTYDCGNGITGEFDFTFNGAPIEGADTDDIWQEELRNAVKKYDANRDGYISDSEASSITTVRLTLSENSDGYVYYEYQNMIEIGMLNFLWDLTYLTNLKNVYVTVPNTNNASKLYSPISEPLDVRGATFDDSNNCFYNITGNVSFSTEFLSPDSLVRFTITLS